MAHLATVKNNLEWLAAAVAGRDSVRAAAVATAKEFTLIFKVMLVRRASALPTR